MNLYPDSNNLTCALHDGEKVLIKGCVEFRLYRYSPAHISVYSDISKLEVTFYILLQSQLKDQV
jgi:hypothetical protein